MSRICEICGKGPTASISRSHSHIATHVRKLPNLQSKKINGRRKLVCTNCLKNMIKS